MYVSTFLFQEGCLVPPRMKHSLNWKHLFPPNVYLCTRVAQAQHTKGNSRVFSITYYCRRKRQQAADSQREKKPPRGRNGGITEKSCWIFAGKNIGNPQRTAHRTMSINKIVSMPKTILEKKTLAWRDFFRTSAQLTRIDAHSCISIYIMHLCTIQMVAMSVVVAILPFTDFTNTLTPLGRLTTANVILNINEKLIWMIQTETENIVNW